MNKMFLLLMFVAGTVFGLTILYVFQTYSDYKLLKKCRVSNNVYHCVRIYDFIPKDVSHD